MGTSSIAQQPDDAVAAFRRPSRIDLSEPVDSDTPRELPPSGQAQAQADKLADAKASPPAEVTVKRSNKLNTRALVGITLGGAVVMAFAVGGVGYLTQHAPEHAPGRVSALGSVAPQTQPQRPPRDANSVAQSRISPPEAAPPAQAAGAPSGSASNRGLGAMPPAVPRPPSAAADAQVPTQAPSAQAVPGSSAVRSTMPAMELMRQASKIVASPMMGDEQVKVLDLVTATNALVLQGKKQSETMVRQVEGLKAETAELRQRLSLAEASAAVAAASQTSSATPAQTQSVKANVAPKANCMARPRYVIASVSPRYVTLRGGSEPMIDLSPGATIPCYGAIREIKQENARWIVKTDHDIIGID